MLTNEFRGLNLTCSQDQIVPFGPSYTNVLYQTCSLPGSTPGSLIVVGDSYMAAAFEFSYSHIWRNLGIIIAQAAVFLIIGIVSTDYLHFTTEATKRVWGRTNRVRRRLRQNWYKTGADALESGTVDSFDEMIGSNESTALGGDDEQVTGAQTSGSVLVVRSYSRMMLILMNTLVE